MPSTSHSTPREPRWQRRPDARPEEIVAAALHVFGERGFARTRLEDVARRAGVSKGTLYLYFDSKEEIFRAMARAKVASSVAEGEEFVRTFEGPTTRLLEEFVRRYWAKMNQPETLRLARVVLFELGSFPELARFYYQEVILRMRALIQSIIDRGVARGEFRAVDSGFTARAVQALTAQLAQIQNNFRAYDPAPLSDDQLVEDLVDLLLHSLVVRSATPLKEGV